MLKDFNTSEFGRRLKRLREKRYKEQPNRFSYCKSQVTFIAKFTLEDPTGKGICRQTFSALERGRVTPTIPELYLLCRLLDCDIEYLLGLDTVICKNVASAAATIGLKAESVNEIRGNKEIAQLLDFLLQKDEFFKLCTYIREEANKRYIESELMRHFDDVLKKKLERAFDRAITKSSPFDELNEQYKRELKATLSPDFLFDGKSGKTKHVSEDILLHIEIAAEESDTLPQTDGYYDLVIDTLMSDSVQPLLCKKEAEQTIGRIAQMFTSIVKPYIEDRRFGIQHNVKRHVKNLRSCPS